MSFLGPIAQLLNFITSRRSTKSPSIQPVSQVDPFIPSPEPLSKPVTLTPEAKAKDVLRVLSYDVDGNWTKALVEFQKHVGLTPDGKFGPKTNKAVEALAEKLKSAPPEMNQMRKWRLTRYYVAEEKDYRAVSFVPVYSSDKKLLAKVPANFFCSMSLEGTGKLKDGRLLNVAGAYISVDPAEYQMCYEVYQAHVAMMTSKGRPPKPSKYFGVSIRDGRVVAAQPFHEVPAAKVGVGYGTGKLGVPYTPAVTLATDIGAYKTSEPTFRGKGGLVPPGTRVFILEYVGVKKPDGTLHDGWFVANDTGGGIFGAHFDVFIGTKSLSDKFPVPNVAHIWFEGLEERVQSNYQYGLYDK